MVTSYKMNIKKALGLHETDKDRRLEVYSFLIHIDALILFPLKLIDLEES